LCLHVDKEKKSSGVFGFSPHTLTLSIRQPTTNKGGHTVGLQKKTAVVLRL